MILVVLHELGHFIASRKFWVKIYEFGIGIPPKIKTLYTDKKWTEYTLNLIPLGGFVRPKGEDSDDPAELNAEDSFYSKKLRQKLIILMAWVTANLIVAFLLFTAAFWHGISPIIAIPDNASTITSESYLFPSRSFLYENWYLKVTKDSTVIGNEPIPNSLTQDMYLQTWDSILAINWENMNNFMDISIALKESIWKELSMTIQRWAENNTYQTKCPEEECMLWALFDWEIKIDKIKFWPIWAMWAAGHEIKAETRMTFQWLGMIFGKLFEGKAKEAWEKLAGPAAAVAIWKFVINIWIFEYLAFIASISLALAIFNILPIPALDGWRAFVVTIMTLFKVPVSKYINIENLINLVFFIILMSLWIYILIQDIQNFY